MYTEQPYRENVYVVRNEIDLAYAFHCDAVAAQLPFATEIDFVAGDRLDLETVDGVVLTGSTAGVYESDRRSWIADQERLVRELVERKIPTLGICFGHQVANSALGGVVEEVGMTSSLVEATLADDPLFDGVESTVVSIHGDVVIEPGEKMDVIASADHAHVFATRHANAPLWTVQFHPELTDRHHETVVADFGWEKTALSFADVTAGRIFENFAELTSEYLAGQAVDTANG